MIFGAFHSHGLILDPGGNLVRPDSVRLYKKLNEILSAISILLKIP
jgi:hypothetical protein